VGAEREEHHARGRDRDPQGPRGAVSALTGRAERVLFFASHGFTVKGTAWLMNVSEDTVRRHRTRARRMLEARNTTHAVAIAIRMGLLS
jgi:DNA-binding CsgD family transcriptional regulator